MQILGLLGMYFDAVVVEVEKSLLFSDWLWPYCVCKHLVKSLPGTYRKLKYNFNSCFDPIENHFLQIAFNLIFY